VLGCHPTADGHNPRVMIVIGSPIGWIFDSALLGAGQLDHFESAALKQCPQGFGGCKDRPFRASYLHEFDEMPDKRTRTSRLRGRKIADLDHAVAVDRKSKPAAQCMLSRPIKVNLRKKPATSEAKASRAFDISGRPHLRDEHIWKRRKPRRVSMPVQLSNFLLDSRPYAVRPRHHNESHSPHLSTETPEFDKRIS
jgi:hypothetical protein